MQLDDLTRNERIVETLEAAKQRRRRERALLRSPVTAPKGFSPKEVRRLCQETRDEFLRRS